MSAIFMSASVPVEGRGNFYKDSDPFLIQHAVRELVTTAIGRRVIVCEGHPAITPMVWAICESLGVDYSKAVVLYQSKLFADEFPEENKKFGNVEYVECVPGDKEQSLIKMREAMLSREDLDAAVFIGGMDGVLKEYDVFKMHHPTANVVPVPAPGGAARQLAKTLGVTSEADLNNTDFVTIFHNELNISPVEPRTI
jgi:hypothetical protein